MGTGAADLEAVRAAGPPTRPCEAPFSVAPLISFSLQREPHSAPINVSCPHSRRQHSSSPRHITQGLMQWDELSIFRLCAMLG